MGNPFEGPPAGGFEGPGEPKEHPGSAEQPSVEDQFSKSFINPLIEQMDKNVRETSDAVSVEARELLDKNPEELLRVVQSDEEAAETLKRVFPDYQYKLQTDARLREWLTLKYREFRIGDIRKSIHERGEERIRARTPEHVTDPYQAIEQRLTGAHSQILELGLVNDAAEVEKMIERVRRLRERGQRVIPLWYKVEPITTRDDIESGGMILRNDGRRDVFVGSKYLRENEPDYERERWPDGVTFKPRPGEEVISYNPSPEVRRILLSALGINDELGGPEKGRSQHGFANIEYSEGDHDEGVKFYGTEYESWFEADGTYNRRVSKGQLEIGL